MTRSFGSTVARSWLVFALLAGYACAQRYDAVTGFSSTTNTESSRWSYRYNTTGTRDGNYQLLTPAVNNGSADWYEWGKILTGRTTWVPEDNDGLCPCIAANQTKVPLITNYGFDPVLLEFHSIFEHPSVTATVGDTVLSFLVPKTGTVTVTYLFTHIDPYGGNGINWYIDLNSGMPGDLYHGHVQSTPGHVGTTGMQSFNLAVTAGDRLNFIIDSNGDFNHDSTAMKAIIVY